MADYDEYLRLLYVAITRARDELYICGSVGERNTNIDKSWYRLVENALAKIGVKNEDNGITRHATSHIKPLPQTVEKAEKKQFMAPGFLFEKVVHEKPALEEIEEVPEFLERAELVNYGKKVHKVLEVIGRIPAAKRELYLEYIFPDDGATREEISQLLAAPELAEAKSEVPVIGLVGNKIISGRIDRLLVGATEVKIIDFKTSRKVPQIMPERYIKQMDNYAAIIGLQYPQHKIGKYILWTSAAKLVELA